MPSLQPVIPSEILQELASPRFAEIAPRFPMHKGRKLGVQGKPCTRLYLLAEGQVLLSRKDEAGQENALYLLGPGEIFGAGALLPEQSWLTTARALTDGYYHALPGARVATLAEYYPQLAAQLFALLAARLERAYRRLDFIVKQSARDRLLGLLAVLASYHGEEHGEQVWLPVKVTQAQLGSMVGLARETVARTLSDLEAEGIVRRQGREGYWLCRKACWNAVETES